MDNRDAAKPESTAERDAASINNVSPKCCIPATFNNGNDESMCSTHSLSEVDEDYDPHASMRSLSDVDEDEIASEDDDDYSADDESDPSMPALEEREEAADDDNDGMWLPAAPAAVYAAMIAEREDDSVSDDTSSHGSMPALIRRDDIYSDDDDESDDSSLMPPLLIPRDRSGNESDDSLPPLEGPNAGWRLSIETFPQLTELSDDVITHIFSFVADVPFEEKPRGRRNTNRDATLTHVLPLVCKHFHSLCEVSVNYHWKNALMRLVRDEPMLWKEGLLRVLPEPNEVPHETPKEFVERVFATGEAEDYRQLFQLVVQQYLRVTKPVFYMPGSVRLGRQFGVHLFEPRYRLLISNVMENFPEASRQGDDIVPNEDGNLPTFIYAHSNPLRVGSSACLVQVKNCIIHEDGTADCSLMPCAYVRLERVWEVPDTGALHEAVALRMGRQASEREDRSTYPDLDFMELLQGGIDMPNFGIRGTIHAILAYLANHGEEEQMEGLLSDEEELEEETEEEDWEDTDDDLPPLEER